MVLIIILLQLIYFFADFENAAEEDPVQNGEVVRFQKKIDSLRKAAAEADSLKIFPFNPNFITDYKGYSLGMEIEEIDRLLAYRASGKWMNSAVEFQRVTGVSDSLLQKIAPAFRFPEWVNSGKRILLPATAVVAETAYRSDLNAATAEDLKDVKGVGEVLASRIINYRNKIGGFRGDIQLRDVYGLNLEVRKAIEERFTVKSFPETKVYNINEASVLELSSVPYINYELAREIINYRLLHEGISSFEELSKLRDFPSEKIDRIALYLTLK